MQVLDNSSGEGEEGVPMEKEGEGDPLIPISHKWPTMLELSATEREGEEMADGGDTLGRASPHLTVRCGAPCKVYGESQKKGTVTLSKEVLGGAVGRSSQLGALGVPRFRAGDFDFAGTPNLRGQGERRGRGEPGEPGAARAPLLEEQTEPRAAGQSSSPGRMTQRRLVADAPGERCGGKSFAPASAAAS
ncbi:hypothetical protein NDU88_006732 [Pleurodeles waltl]|uniref:Uncharacterized protein n=1 Tax=Pleurodeles waltl TaxID=8319 RepID=A0AAV7UMS3_PLEWA|nr:hypothetical protein NDU88_006732 [Pleurodeles waltl]